MSKALSWLWKLLQFAAVSTAYGIKEAWGWFAHLNMNRVVIGLLVVGWGIFFWSQLDESSAAYGALPLGTALSSLIAAQLYVIDRWGFKKIDTIQLLQHNGWLYVAYMGLYLVAGIAGYVLAFAFSRF